MVEPVHHRCHFVRRPYVAVSRRQLAVREKGDFKKKSKLAVREKGDFNKKSKFLNVRQRKNLRHSAWEPVDDQSKLAVDAQR
jgi:hypothetical protein